MQLVIAIVILICVAIVLLLLFYLVTRYFNHRLQKTLQNQNQVYSMIDGIEANRSDLMDGQYSDFAQNKMKEWKKQEQERKRTYMDIAGQGILRQSLFQSEFNVYEKSPLERRLERQPIPIGSESVRSNATPKSFSVEKLQSFRSNNSMKSNQTYQINRFDKNKNTTITKHKFISKLVAFKQQKISIIQNLVSQIWMRKGDSQIRERRKILKSVINKNDRHYLDCIQAYGFEQNMNGAFKYNSTVSVPNMRPQIIYSIKQLEQNEEKQQIQINQFYLLAEQLEQR